MNRRVVIIVGPTAVGKTSLSLRLAEKMGNAEIVSADSRQVYKLMNIGTAKPSADELARIPHHFIDIKYPDEYYSAGKYSSEARQKIHQLLCQHKTPIIVGGSGLYIRALVDGFFDKQIYDENIKEKLKQEITIKGISFLYDRLKDVDPESAEKIHPNDQHRIVRALEVFELTGVPLSSFQSQQNVKANFDPIFIGINRERQQLYQVIEKRVDRMLDQGLIKEVEALQKLGYHANLNSMQTVGYREVFEYLDGKINFDLMVRLIKQRTRNYAKRQLTWFKKDQRIHWFKIDQSFDFDQWFKSVFDMLITGK